AAILSHRILHGLALADEIEHQHRMRKERHERREDAERDVAPDIGAARHSQADDRGHDEAGQPDADGGEKRLSHDSSKYHASPFVMEWLNAIAPSIPHPKRAIDLAMGRGRHAIELARAGFRTFGVDVQHAAVRDAVVAAAREGLIVRGWCADLTRSSLPRQW